MDLVEDVIVANGERAELILVIASSIRIHEMFFLRFVISSIKEWSGHHNVIKLAVSASLEKFVIMNTGNQRVIYAVRSVIILSNSSSTTKVLLPLLWLW